MITAGIFSCIFVLKAVYARYKKAELKEIHFLLKYSAE